MKLLEKKMAAEPMEWPGASGAKYPFWFVDLSLRGLFSQPGCYMFVRLTNRGWVPFYVGIADDLSVRLNGHERWPEAYRLGATHLMAQVQVDQAARERAERDLIAHYNPPLNTHHRTDQRQAG
jgi:hypothetical protein